MQFQTQLNAIYALRGSLSHQTLQFLDFTIIVGQSLRWPRWVDIIMGFIDYSGYFFAQL